jgi:hypothetical protein
MPGRTISLETIQVASPCDASWDDMAGTERMRFCHLCQKTVYNLSVMTREQAEKLIRQKEGKMCVRLYKRRDGTVMISDCPVGLRAVRRRAALLVGGAAACLLALVGSAAAFAGMKFAARLSRGAGNAILNVVRPEPPDGIMGDICPVGPPPPPPNPPPPPPAQRSREPRSGRRAAGPRGARTAPGRPLGWPAPDRPSRRRPRSPRPGGGPFPT